MAKRHANRHVGENLQKGLAHHRADRLVEAFAAYAKVLRAEPAHADALHLSGLVARQQGELRAAERLIARAIECDSSVGVYRYNLGITREALGQRSEALLNYREAVSLDPNNFEFQFKLAAAFYESRKFAEAAEAYRQATLRMPEDANAHYCLGVVLQKMGDAAAAAQAYAKALQFKPDFPDAFSNLGFLCVGLGDLQLAEKFLRRALELQPNHVNANCNLANVLVNRGDTAGALAQCRIALSLDPHNALILCNYGALCTDTGDLQTAVNALRRSIAIDPINIDARCNLANALAKQGDVLAAAETTRNALALNPRHALTLCNFGVLQDSLGNFDEAVRLYLRSLDAEPDFKLAQYNLSIQRLSAGDFAAGWRDYEARWDLPEFRNQRPPDLLQPQWRGEEIRGSRIVIHSEQGLGDTIQFARYLPMLAALGTTVVVRVPAALVHIVSTLDPSVHVVPADSKEGADFEWRCPLMSLPLAFNTHLATIPATVPYLKANPIATEGWSLRLPARGLRVGLVWAGSPGHPRDRERSIALEQFGRLTRAVHRATGGRGVAFYSLQKGPAAHDLAASEELFPITDLSEYLEDFTDTAAMIANLDLLISVDTAVAHLAGALGKPVWMLVSRVSDWRWLRDRSDSPWYPNVVLFRQAALGQWDDVFNRVEGALRSMLDTTPSPAFAALHGAIPAPAYTIGA
jgi:tetratricopeptide (TPR) repeat protein